MKSLSYTLLWRLTSVSFFIIGYCGACALATHPTGTPEISLWGRKYALDKLWTECQSGPLDQAPQNYAERCRSDSNLLDHILFILSQASNLTALDVMPQIQHSSVISLLPITCMHSLSCLNLSIMPEATNAINILDELEGLVTLGIDFYGHGFRLPASCKPWNLIQLKTLTWWTSQNIDNQSSNYLTERLHGRYFICDGDSPFRWY
jgi:hypothetical protein